MSAAVQGAEGGAFRNALQQIAGYSENNGMTRRRMRSIASNALSASPSTVDAEALQKALHKAENALVHAGAELIRIWGEDEGDDPVILDALASIRAALAQATSK